MTISYADHIAQEEDVEHGKSLDRIKRKLNIAQGKAKPGDRIAVLGPDETLVVYRVVIGHLGKSRTTYAVISDQGEIDDFIEAHPCLNLEETEVAIISRT